MRSIGSGGLSTRTTLAGLSEEFIIIQWLTESAAYFQSLLNASAASMLLPQSEGPYTEWLEVHQLHYWCAKLSIPVPRGPLGPRSFLPPRN
jgi:hypothetical protein